MSNAKRVKATMEFTKLQPGDEFTGRLVATQERELKDQNTGNMKTVNLLVFEKMDLIDGVPKDLPERPRCGIWEDAGLRAALQDAFAEPGSVLEIHKLEKAELSGGRSVNQYDVYTYPEHSQPIARPVQGTEARA